MRWNTILIFMAGILLLLTTCGNPIIKDYAKDLFCNHSLTVTATCTVAGTETRTCNRKPEHNGTQPIPALGHASFTGLICNVCGNQADLGEKGPGGGIIFYRLPAGFTVEGYTGTSGSFSGYTAHYLEAAPVDSGTAVLWGALNALINSVSTFDVLSEPLAAKIGNGRKDTMLIVAHLGVNESGRAAQIASAEQGAKNDWFLPSLGELNLMYLAKAAGTEGLPASGWYWSSSQYNSSNAWLQIFDYGNQWGTYDKNNGISVRPIRAF